MRHHYLLPAFAAALLVAPRAHAQQPWQPFRPGLTYQLTEAATPGDTTHTLRVAAGTPVAGTADTLFRFGARVSLLSVPASTAPCRSRQALQPDNLFGATLRSQPSTAFVLAAANGRTLLLRPRAALGASWATGVSGLTASVTARGQAPVLGGAPDSVVTIQFSDGEVLQLSKRFGWLSGPSLDSYLNGRYRRRQLALTALPERRLGAARLGALTVFDYQPGDYFQRTTRSYATTQYLCQQVWWQDSVLTRATSVTGDTLTYTIRTRRRVQTFGFAGAPPGLCSTPAANTLMAPTTSTVRVIGSKGGDFGQQLLTGFASGTSNGRQYTSAVSRNSARFGGRPEFTQRLRFACANSSPDSVVVGPIPDADDILRYAAGLGLTYRLNIFNYSEDITELTAFRKGSQTWGTPFAPTTFLAARPARAAVTTTAFPNPFGDGLTVRFSLAGAQAVGATLYDALGRAVHATAARPLAAGAQQLSLPTSALPLGVYTLVLDFGADGHRETLRVAKSE